MANFLLLVNLLGNFVRIQTLFSYLNWVFYLRFLAVITGEATDHMNLVNDFLSTHVALLLLNNLSRIPLIIP